MTGSRKVLQKILSRGLSLTLGDAESVMINDLGFTSVVHATQFYLIVIRR
jgi:hypothetical protein